MSDASEEPSSISAPGHQPLLGGLLAGLGAYGAWGVVPIYFKALGHIPPIEVLAHRIVWSFALLSVYVTALRRTREFVGLVKQRRVLVPMLASATLMAFNWTSFQRNSSPPTANTVRRPM